MRIKIKVKQGVAFNGDTNEKTVEANLDSAYFSDSNGHNQFLCQDQFEIVKEESKSNMNQQIFGQEIKAMKVKFK